VTGVDEWLVLNKTCPFCKRSIDASESESQKPASTLPLDETHSDTEQEQTSIEIPGEDLVFDRRSLGPDFDHDLAVALAMSLNEDNNLRPDTS
jgi:hypothetical protein